MRPYFRADFIELMSSCVAPALPDFSWRWVLGWVGARWMVTAWRVVVWPDLRHGGCAAV